MHVYKTVTPLAKGQIYFGLIAITIKSTMSIILKKFTFKHIMGVKNKKFCTTKYQKFMTI